MKFANLSEDEKTKRLLLAQEHLELAKRQRHYYNDKVAANKSAISQLSNNKSVTLCYSLITLSKFIIPVIHKIQDVFTLKLHVNVEYLEYVKKAVAHN